MVLNMLTLDLDCLAAVPPWIWFGFLGFFGFLTGNNLGFGLLLGFLDWIWISFGSDWIGNPKVGLGRGTTTEAPDTSVAGPAR